MRLYSRSDVVAVAVPLDSGGCGTTHTRPVIQGAPAKLFALDCPACTLALKGDPLWAGDQLKIPLTPDEESLAEDMEKKGDAVMHQVSAALAQSSIQAMRDAQSKHLDAWQQQSEQDDMSARYNELQQELASLRALISQPELSVTPDDRGIIPPVPVTGVTVTGSAPQAPDGAQDVPQAASGASAVRTTGKTARNTTAKPGACTSCGGSLRKPGQRGPTPKGTCMSCRAEAREA
jgi:hypothetical protein